MLRKFGALTMFTAMVAGSILISCSSGGSGGSSESAEDYPSNMINILVGFPAGGPTDLAARPIAPAFEEEFGQTVTVENQPGASGAVALKRLVDSSPDGYLIGVVSPGSAVVTPLIEDVGYTKDDYVTIGAITELPAALFVQSGSPYNSADELLAAASENPGTINVGTPGAQTTEHIELLRLAQLYGIQVNPVPFDGDAEASTAVLGGNVDAAFVKTSQNAISQTESGELNPLVTGSAERLSYLPDIPTLRELGYEDLTLTTAFFGLVAPKDTPEGIVQKLEDTLSGALEDPEVVEQLDERYVPEEFISGAELRESYDEASSAYEPILTE